MKYFFSVILLALVAASVVTRISSPEVESEIPVLYWTTDPNPARRLQVATFHDWLEREHGDDLERRYGFRRFELRLDTGNRGLDKQLIQGVSGVAGDLMDIWSGNGDIAYLHQVGMLRDITEPARARGFSHHDSWASMAYDLTVEGEGGRRIQVAYPANVTIRMYFINEATFRRHGKPLPPERWTVSEFERRGREFVSDPAVNPPGRRQQVFFADTVDHHALRRSLGVSMFNETLTWCTLDDPRNAQVLRTIYDWTYVDRILPSAADRQAFAAEGGLGGAGPQLFRHGNYAMFQGGRYMLITLRSFYELDGPIEMRVAEPPHFDGGMPNTGTGTRAVSLYLGARDRVWTSPTTGATVSHEELGLYFLEYLASADYNLQLVEDADALPPNPTYAEGEAWDRPPRFPNEWSVHPAFREGAHHLAIGNDFSPFVAFTLANRADWQSLEKVMSRLASPERAAREAAEQVNAEIRRTLDEQPHLREEHTRRLEAQARIERLREAGVPIPLSWIRNPFHKRHYLFRGWAWDDADAPVPETASDEELRSLAPAEET